MSLYNRLFGETEESEVMLGFIGVNKGMFMRYRDAYLNPEGTIVTVVTRTGGNNRKDYRQSFTDARKNENYIRDFDDDFDSTYCYFEFAKKMAPENERLSVGAMFKQEVEEAQIPGSPAFKRQQEIAEAIFNAMESGDHFITL